MTTTIPLPGCVTANALAAAVRLLAPEACRLVEILHNAPHLRPAPDARYARFERRAEGVEHDAVVVHQPDERQRRRDLLAVVQLGRIAEVHRQARVEQRVEVQVFLFEEELQEQLVEPAVDVPVDVPEVVADGVVAVVGELDRRARAACSCAPPSSGRQRSCGSPARAVRACGGTRGRAGVALRVGHRRALLATSSRVAGSDQRVRLDRSSQPVRDEEQPEHQRCRDAQADQPGDQRGQEDRPARPQAERLADGAGTPAP